MSRFSDRVGATSPPSLAREETSEHFKTALWNTFQPMLLQSRTNYLDWGPRLKLTYKYLHGRVNSVSAHEPTETQRLENWFFSPDRQWYLARFNEIFEDEGSVYRFVDGVLTTITDPIELEAVAD